MIDIIHNFKNLTPLKGYYLLAKFATLALIELTTGIDNPEDGNGTTIYDPQQQYLTVLSSASQTATLMASGDIAEVNACDLAGRLLLSTALPVPAPVTTVTLPSGVAIVKVRLTSGTYLQTKLIVQ